MRRALLYVAGWLVAAAAATAVAWQGVEVVAQRVTEARPAPLSLTQVAAEVAAEAAAGGPGAGAGAGTPTGGQPVPATGEEAAPPPEHPAPTGPPAASSPTTAAGPTVPPAGTSVPTVPATSATTGTTAAPPTAAPPAGEVRSYSTTGGAVGLRFAPGGVSVLWANPNPGFEVSVDEAHGGGVSITFRSDRHRSRLDAWWSGGPQDRVREDG